MAIERKFIKVLTEAPIAAKGYMYGPILTPYHESLALIGSMIMGGVNVVEVLNDGSELELDLNNFSIENNPVVEEVVTPVTPVTPPAATPTPAAAPDATPPAATPAPAATPTPTKSAPADATPAPTADKAPAPAADNATTKPAPTK